MCVLQIPIIRAARGKPQIVIPSVHMDGQEELPLIVQASSPFRSLFSARQSRQKERSEDSYDGDDHEQLDECEAGPGLAVMPRNNSSFHANILAASAPSCSFSESRATSLKLD